MIFSTLELSEKQQRNFAQLMIVIVSSEKALQNIGRVMEIIEVLATPKAQISQKDSLNNSTLPEEDSQEELSPENLEQLLQEQELVEAPLLGFLEIEDPESLTNMVELMVNLPESSYRQLMGLMNNLSTKHAEYLGGLVTDLNAAQGQQVLDLAGSVSGRNLPPLLDRLIPLSDSKVLDTVETLSSISAADLNTLISTTTRFDNSAFKALLSVIDKVSAAQLKKLLNIGKKLPAAEYAAATKVADSYNGVYTGRVIDVMANIDIGAVKDLVDMAQRIKSNQSIARKGVDVLTELKNATTQMDLLTEAKFLNTSNLTKGVEVMDEVKSDATKKMIDISKSLSKGETKNKLADQLYSILNPVDDGVRGTSYNIRNPVAVAGVRGKARQNATTEATLNVHSGSGIFPYSPPALQQEAKKTRINRVINLVDKVTEVNDSILTTDLLNTSDELDNRGLVRGADVFIGLDIDSDKQRARRLVNIYQKTEVNMRTSAIDTLHDISTSHVTAAVDIAHEADQNLMESSIVFAERLKYRLGEEDGLSSTERVINVASRVKTNRERRRGLAALSSERDVRIRRILKQVDGNNEPAFLDAPQGSTETPLYNRERINTITDLYLKLDAENPKESPTHRTPAVKLADTLSGSHGLVLGAKDGEGISRYVTQDRKNYRIRQYLDEANSTDPYDRARFDARVERITGRPIQVPHSGSVNSSGVQLIVRESNFDIRLPEAIKVNSGDANSNGQNAGL
jgi:hypothetical protein